MQHINYFINILVFQPVGCGLPSQLRLLHKLRIYRSQLNHQKRNPINLVSYLKPGLHTTTKGWYIFARSYCNLSTSLLSNNFNYSSSFVPKQDNAIMEPIKCYICSIFISLPDFVYSFHFYDILAQIRIL